MKLDLACPRTRTCLAVVGVLYVYGAGTPADGRDPAQLGIGVTSPKDPRLPAERRRGWDCFGQVQATAVALGDLDPGQVDRTAHTGAMEALDAIDEADAQVGDVVLYDSDGDGHIEHAGIYVGGGMVVTMSGGTSRTFGDDPNACGQLRPVHYRRVRTFARWKSSVRPRLRPDPRHLPRNAP